MKSTTLQNGSTAASLKQISYNVLQNHLNSFSDNDLEQLMTDYSDQSVLITKEASYKGLGQIKSYFSELITHFPKNQSTFELDKLVISEDLVFIIWHANSATVQVPFATDTLIIKEGKILKQTFAGQINPLQKG